MNEKIDLIQAMLADHQIVKRVLSLTTWRTEFALLGFGLMICGLAIWILKDKDRTIRLAILLSIMHQPRTNDVIETDQPD